MDYLDSLTEKCKKTVTELFPWEIIEPSFDRRETLIVDVREPYEYSVGHIKNSINVPRGILETASNFGYEDTVPELASARGKKIVLACRSGKRSLWAGCTMLALGFKDVFSLKTGIRGWNDYEQPLFDEQERQVDIKLLDQFFEPDISADKLGHGWVIKDWRV